jgi:hypothetical protein
MVKKGKLDRRGDEWLVAIVRHEGFPLALRVRAHADSPRHRKRWPRLAEITHTLAKVRRNGLPQTAYNEGLAEFDHAVIVALERDGRGIVALIETFAGRRTYYAYVAKTARASTVVAPLRKSYPQHHLKAGARSDPAWGLYAEYRSRWPW